MRPYLLLVRSDDPPLFQYSVNFGRWGLVLKTVNGISEKIFAKGVYPAAVRGAVRHLVILFLDQICDKIRRHEHVSLG